jgi:hypothetical protein
MTFRGLLYLLGRILGDIQAIKKGRLGQRIGRRARWQGHRPFVRQDFQVIVCFPKQCKLWIISIS